MEKRGEEGGETSHGMRTMLCMLSSIIDRYKIPKMSKTNMFFATTLRKKGRKTYTRTYFNSIDNDTEHKNLFFFFFFFFFLQVIKLTSKYESMSSFRSELKWGSFLRLKTIDRKVWNWFVWTITSDETFISEFNELTFRIRRQNRGGWELIYEYDWIM